MKFKGKVPDEIINQLNRNISQKTARSTPLFKLYTAVFIINAIVTAWIALTASIVLLPVACLNLIFLYISIKFLNLPGKILTQSMEKLSEIVFSGTINDDFINYDRTPIPWASVKNFEKMGNAVVIWFTEVEHMVFTEKMFANTDEWGSFLKTAKTNSCIKG
jgi:hypothetical protein